MQQQSSEDVVNIDLQELVLLIDGTLEVNANFHCVLDIINVGVDHHGISVSVDDLQLRAFRKVFGTPQDLSAFEGREHSQGPGVEPRLRVSKTTVHGIGSQFQGKLFDVPCGKLVNGSFFVFHESLDLPSTADECSNELGQYTLVLVHRNIRNFLIVLRLLVVSLIRLPLKEKALCT